MEWTEERRQLVSQLSAQGLSPGQIAARIGGISENAMRTNMHRLGLFAEDMRGTRVFTTARGKKVRKQVKPRVAKKVSLARVSFADR